MFYPTRLRLLAKTNDIIICSQLRLLLKSFMLILNTSAHSRTFFPIRCLRTIVSFEVGVANVAASLLDIG